MKKVVFFLMISCFFLVQCQKDEAVSDYSYAENYDFGGAVTAGDITIKKNLDTVSLNKYVRNIPISASTSLKTLAQYLADGASTELQKAYLIYYWITNNISYNVKHSGTWKEESSEVVLANKTAVCEGYSQLYANLATRMKLQVVKIHGYSKTSAYVPSDGISKDVGHAWNAVCINGDWYLLDSTWGAGYVSNSTFFFMFTDRYFLMLPEQFLQSHYPEVTKWELVSPLISFSDFTARYGVGFASGKGKYYYYSGDIYDGEWKNGKKHGQGTYYFSDGKKWVGLFQNDVAMEGNMYDSNGNLTTFKGTFTTFVEPVYKHTL